MAQALLPGLLRMLLCRCSDAEDIHPCLAPFIFLQPLGLTAIREDECLSDPGGILSTPASKHQRQVFKVDPVPPRLLVKEILPLFQKVEGG